MPTYVDLKKSANLPTDDVSPAGGSNTGVSVNPATAGDLVPHLDFGENGGLQYQLGYLQNIDATGTIEADPETRVYIREWIGSVQNDLRRMVFSSNHADDNSTKYVRIYGHETDGSSTVQYEDVTLAAEAEVMTSLYYSRVRRVELRRHSDDALVTAADDIGVAEELIPGNPASGIPIGAIRQGTSYSSNEFSIALAVSKGDESVRANRLTPPAAVTSAGYFLSSYGHTVDFPDDLSPGEYIGVYILQSCHRQMPAWQPTITLVIDGKLSGAGFEEELQFTGSSTRILGGTVYPSTVEHTYPVVETPLLGHRSEAFALLETPLLGHRSEAPVTNVATPILGHSSATQAKLETELLGHYGRAGVKIETALLGHSAPADRALITPLLGHRASNLYFDTPLLGHSSAHIWVVETPLLGHSARQFAAPENLGEESPFRFAIRTNKYDPEDLEVRFTSSSGGSAALCAAHTLTIEQRASSTQTFALGITDRKMLWHPKGSGPYADVLVPGAEVSIRVNYKGGTENFFGTYKRPRASVRGAFGPAAIGWAGVCEAEKLFKEKKTLETLNYDPVAEGVDKLSAMSEAASAAGVRSDWSGIRNQRLGGPYHRQNMTPGKIVGDLLKLTVDEYRTDYKTVTGYDPDAGGQKWEYDLDSDNVVGYDMNPLPSDEFTQVKVLRAIHTSEQQDEAVGAIDFSDFGKYGLAFNPSISLATVRVDYASPLGYPSNYFWFRNEVLIAARRVIGYNGLGQAVGGNRIWEADRMEVTWGERNPDITATSAPGRILIYGRRSPSGTIGLGFNSVGRIDRTTEVIRGTEGYSVEMPPNPLFYGQQEMALFGDRYLARVGRSQIEHSLDLPLNFLIKCGDKVRLNLGRRFGGRSVVLLVVGWRHTIAREFRRRGTQLTCVEYA